MTAVSFQDLDYVNARPLTVRQQRILTFIRRFWREHQCSPSLREIQAGVGLRHSNTGGSMPYSLDRLEERGLVRIERSGPSQRMRAIVPLGDGCPCCGRAN